MGLDNFLDSILAYSEDAKIIHTLPIFTVGPGNRQNYSELEG